MARHTPRRRGVRPAPSAPPRPVRTPIVLDDPRAPELRALDRLGWFRGASWAPWWTALCALLADPTPPTPDELALYTQCTGRAQWPAQRHREGWFVVGRRGGKTAAMAKLAVAVACFTDCTARLQPGEVATVMCLAADRKQAGVLFRYIVGRLQSDPALAALIVGEPKREGIQLANRVTIEIHTSNFRSTRGYTALCIVADETAFWSREHRSNPDTEVLTALRPTLKTIPWSLLLAISTPYARRGALYEECQEHWGKDGRVLVWKADTLTMNPTFDPAEVAAATAKDAAAARAEYGAEFRSDLESFLSREVVEQAVDVGAGQRPPQPGVGYVAFVDPSGAGSERADSMTLAVAHAELDAAGRVLAVVDLVLEARPPFNPDQVVGTFCEALALYGIGTVEGDLYARSWPQARFAAYGIGYSPAPRSKSDTYLEWLPLLSAGRVRLLDVPRLTQQLLALERRSGRSGKDAVDHPPGGKHDLANAVAGACVLAVEVAQQQDLTALETLSPHELAFHARYAAHFGLDPVSVHPDYVAPDWTDEERW